jgi:hypothetical protein
VHTTFSYDGVLTVEELAVVARNAGWTFMLVTEHSDGLTRDAFHALDRQCREASRDGFVMFPSVEYTCDQNIHVLGYGAGFIDHAPRSPAAMATTIQERGGLAILAHPRKYTRRDPRILTEEILTAVSGVEVWNSKLAYDGPWIAPVRNYDFLRSGKIAMCGQDAHYYRHFSSLVIELHGIEVTRDSILAALGRGQFTMTNGPFTMSPLAPRQGAMTLLARVADRTMSAGLTQALRVRDVVKGSGAAR